MNEKKRISKEESAIYEWQKWVPGFGEEGQQKLKNATVLISRCGGLGSVAAYELAAAGVGKLVIAHGGNVKSSDIHRQLLLTYDWIGKPRIESIKKKLNDLNPFVEIEGIGENVNEKNASELVGRADLVLDCAPLFQERKLMNQEAVKKGIPMVECAMYELEAQISTFLPGKTPCLECLFPEDPPAWKALWPVWGLWRLLKYSQAWVSLLQINCFALTSGICLFLPEIFYVEKTALSVGIYHKCLIPVL